MTTPIPVRVLRHKCPHCPKSYNRPGRTREHMDRCWFNPEARGCKTCKHFEPAESDPADWSIGYGGHATPESCDVDVDLSGRPACKNCSGFGDLPGAELGMTECPDCGGDGAEVKPGPIVHCHAWELKTEEDE